MSLSSTGAAATAAVNGSPYAIIASSAVGSGLTNYTISYVNGSLTVIKASPAITTTPSADSITLGTSSVTLNDTAVLSAAITRPGQSRSRCTWEARWRTRRRCRSAATARYTTPTGYTLPTTGTVTGTYQWDASLWRRHQQQDVQREQRDSRAGDREQGEPDDHHDPQPDRRPAGHGDDPDRHGHAGRRAITRPARSPSRSIPAAARTGYGDGRRSTATARTPRRRATHCPSSAASGVYQWDASYSGDANNNATTDNNDPAEQVTVVSPCCNLQNIAYSVYNPATMTTTTPADLSGNTQQGDTITVTFTVPTGDYDQISLVSYNAPEAFYNADDANLQTVFQSVTQVEAPGTHTLSVTLPQELLPGRLRLRDGDHHARPGRDQPQQLLPRAEPLYRRRQRGREPRRIGRALRYWRGLQRRQCQRQA